VKPWLVLLVASAPLLPATIIEGTVVNDSTGEPITGVSVQLYRPGKAQREVGLR
jgi:hypothetical protein